MSLQERPAPGTLKLVLKSWRQHLPTREAPQTQLAATIRRWMGYLDALSQGSVRDWSYPAIRCVDPSAFCALLQQYAQISHNCYVQEVKVLACLIPGAHCIF